MSDRWTRLLPLTVVLFAGLLVATLVLGWHAPGASAEGAQVISYYRAHSSKQMAADVLGTFSAAFLLFFASTLRTHFRPAAEGLASLGFGGGVLMAGGGATLLAVRVSLADVPSKLDPSSAQALNILANDLLLPLAVGTSAFMIGNGLAIARTGTLPRWLGWVGFVLGISALTPTEIFPLFAIVVWTVIVGVLLYARRGRQLESGGGRPVQEQPSAPSVASSGAPTDPQAALEYARAVHAEHLDSNKDLYLRAQIVLTLDGIVLAAVGTALASKPDDLRKTADVFGWETWAFLGGAGVTLMAAVVSAAMALFSRHRQGPTGHGRQAARDMWFYRRIARHTDDFVKQGRNADALFETHQRLTQVANMAPLMVRRADWLNGAFGFTAATLFCLAVAAIDYALRLQ
jgi:hypothetical protein